ncbi:hypothetical protein MRX96_021186 [Rhipicephalus microplus]
MPLTCCVPGCRSGYRSTTEKAPLFCLPSDREQRDRWKRAIPRQETDAFSFESKAVRVSEKHFDRTDIIRADEFKISGQSVLLQREKPKLRVDAANKSRRSHQDVQKRSAHEKLIFDQWLMKANAKSATAARYKKEWIYDCLLLKIKSTVVYTFLQENGFLPLPNPRTLYGYLRNPKADFGFDSTLFTVLREKLEAVSEREHRGVLMFYEMSVRKKRAHSRVGHGTTGQGGFRRTHTTRRSWQRRLQRAGLPVLTFPGKVVANCGHILCFQCCPKGQSLLSFSCSVLFTSQTLVVLLMQ